MSRSKNLNLSLGDDFSREAVEQSSHRSLNQAWSVVYSQGMDDGLELTYKLATFVSSQRRVVRTMLEMPARQAASWLCEQTGAPIVSCRSVARVLHSLRR